MSRPIIRTLSAGLCVASAMLVLGTLHKSDDQSASRAARPQMIGAVWLEDAPHGLLRLSESLP